MPAGLDTIMAKYELLKKAWDGKKLEDVGKLLLELKIEFASSPPADERVSSFKISSNPFKAIYNLIVPTSFPSGIIDHA